MIGINVNGLMYNGGYNRANMFGLKLDYRTFLPELIATLLKEGRDEVWLVPHTYGPPDSVQSDPEACRKVRSALDASLQQRVRIVTGEYDQHEIKAIIGRCDFFIGSRMHACIAALSQGIPCVGVAYSMKFAGVFESAGIRDWVVDGRTVASQAAIAETVGRYRTRGTVRAALLERAKALRTELETTFHRLIDTTPARTTGGPKIDPQASPELFSRPA